jgi:hypothetical protein
MLNRFLRLFIRCLLWLRYRIRVTGLDRVAPPDGRGVLFLANHPALIDPIMVMTVLWPAWDSLLGAAGAGARDRGHDPRWSGCPRTGGIYDRGQRHGLAPG